jgi:hypothetical protein
MKKSEMKLAEKYLKECLISPPALAGVLDSVNYLKELNYELMSGYRDVDNYSEAVGTIIGGEIVNLLIARCIHTYAAEKNNNRQSLRYTTNLNQLYNRRDAIVRNSKQPLNVRLFTIGAGLNRDYLISAIDSKTILQTEINASAEMKNLRSSALKSFSPSQLVEEFHDEIRAISGHSPVEFSK